MHYNGNTNGATRDLVPEPRLAPRVERSTMKDSSVRTRRTSAKMSERRRNAMPLDELPGHMRDRILAEAAAPSPPDRWIGLGPAGSPRPIAWIESRGWWEWHWARGMDPGLARTPLPTGMRQRVIDRDGYVCQLCGEPVEPTDVHIDHIQPYSKGGDHTLRNLQVSHSLCNMRKGARV